MIGVFPSICTICTELPVIEALTNPNTPAGNKCDLDDDRAVSTERGRELANEFGIEFFETSAKADINVQEAFGKLVDMVCDRMFSESSSAGGRGRNASTVQVAKGDGGKEGKPCCG